SLRRRREVSLFSLFQLKHRHRHRHRLCVIFTLVFALSLLCFAFKISIQTHRSLACVSLAATASSSPGFWSRMINDHFLFYPLSLSLSLSPSLVVVVCC